jgi:hypothetical protein
MFYVSLIACFVSIICDVVLSHFVSFRTLYNHDCFQTNALVTTVPMAIQRGQDTIAP